MSNVANQHPAEAIAISPEALEVANAYLQTPNVTQVSVDLNISPELVTSLLARREVKAYIDNVFMDIGFNNKFKMRAAMDAIIAKKFKELDENDTGSAKDILEILALSHKISKEHMELEIKLEQAKNGGPKNQTNIQLNANGSDGTRYGALLEKLMKC